MCRLLHNPFNKKSNHNVPVEAFTGTTNHHCPGTFWDIRELPILETTVQWSSLNIKKRIINGAARCFHVTTLQCIHEEKPVSDLEIAKLILTYYKSPDKSSPIVNGILTKFGARTPARVRWKFKLAVEELLKIKHGHVFNEISHKHTFLHQGYPCQRKPKQQQAFAL